MAGAVADSVQLQHATSVHGVALESRRAQRRSSFSSVSSMSSMSSSDFVDALSGEDDDFDEMVHNAPDVHVKDEGGATESCNEEEADEQSEEEEQEEQEEEEAPRRILPTSHWEGFFLLA